MSLVSPQSPRPLFRQCQLGTESCGSRGSRRTADRPWTAASTASLYPTHPNPVAHRGPHSSQTMFQQENRHPPADGWDVPQVGHHQAHRASTPTSRSKG
eukprot:scaffold671022_cov50-Prasinocladus_malaysianus.AAC.1